MRAAVACCGVSSLSLPPLAVSPDLLTWSLEIGFIAYAIVITVVVLLERRRPTATLALILALVFLPVVGLLVYLHGGGWVIGDLDSHDNVCRALANGSGHAVLSVDYRLAPEHPFPAALEDAVTATRWAHANAAAMGCRADRLAIGGDSAGGNLAAVVAQLAPVPLTYQLLVYPVTDCTRSHPSYTENAAGPFLTRDGMGWFIDHYLSGGHGSANDPRVSPLFASDTAVAATPPALVITAEFDPLRDEGDAYAARLAALGVPTSHVRMSGMFHGFFSLADFLDDGRISHAAAAAALKAALSR